MTLGVCLVTTLISLTLLLCNSLIITFSLFKIDLSEGFLIVCDVITYT